MAAQGPIASLDLPGDGLAALLTPALLVSRPRVRHNVRAVLEAVGGPDRWRPHVKTLKIPAMLEELIAAGIRQFKCATPREATVLLDLAQPGVALDVLLAHPARGNAAARLARIAAEHPDARVSLLAEDPQAAAGAPHGLGVFVDVNCGMNRTGIPATDATAIEATARAAGDRFRGLHFYDGHLAGGDEATRRRLAHACYDRLVELALALRAAGLTAAELITSGTPTFLHALEHKGLAAIEDAVHRVSPGTVVYHDARSATELPELDPLDLRPAAIVLSTVVSHPGPDRVTCDAGSKSIAAEAGDPCALVANVPDLVARTPSEEHLPLDVVSGTPPLRGTVLQLVPRHVCPTVNLAEQAMLLEAGGEWSIVDVTARGHEIVLEETAAIE